MSQQKQPAPARQKVKETFRTIWGLGMVSGLLTSCALLYAPFRSTWLEVVGFLVFLVSMPGSFVLAHRVCYRRGLSLAKQEPSAFILPAPSRQDSSAELRVAYGQPQARVIVSLASIAIVFVVIPPRSHSTAEWAFPLGLAALGLLMSLAQWNKKKKLSLVARADRNGLLGIGPRGKRVHVQWSQIAHVVQVEHFDMFGGIKGTLLCFEDEWGQTLVSVPLRAFKPEVETHFLSVVSRYLNSPWR